MHCNRFELQVMPLSSSERLGETALPRDTGATKGDGINTTAAVTQADTSPANYVCWCYSHFKRSPRFELLRFVCVDSS